MLLLLLLSPLFLSVARPRRRDTATTTTTPLSSCYLRSRLHGAATITFIYKLNHHSLQRLPSLHYFAQPPLFHILSSLSSLQTVLLPSPLSLSTFVMSLENVHLNSTKNVVGIKSNPILSHQQSNKRRKTARSPRERSVRRGRKRSLSWVQVSLKKEKLMLLRMGLISRQVTEMGPKSRSVYRETSSVSLLPFSYPSGCHRLCSQA